MKTTDEIRSTVRDRYGRLAEQGSGCGCAPSSCCGPAPMNPARIARALGYTDKNLAAIPEDANLALGCGNPLAYADVKPGETVLDLGSGAGMDVFAAAAEVGPNGRVIGVDMTAEMIERARRNARNAAVTNVEFRLGEIEHLPVEDNSVDAIISNCVINLSPEKPQVFREALRVLKPGGRLVVSDLVLKHEISKKLREDVAAYVSCVAGASLRDDYLLLIREAGFENVAVAAESSYEIGLNELPSDMQREALEAVTSIKVRARKPR